MGRTAKLAPRWEVTIPGHHAHRAWFVEEDVWVADGWGVAYGKLALRRLALADGDERGAVRLGNQARCLAQLGPDRFLAATDSKLWRVDASTYTAEKLGPAPVKFPDTLLARGDDVLASNWRGPTIASTSRPRRFSTYSHVLPGVDDVVLVGGDGRVARTPWDLTTAPEVLLKLPAVVDASRAGYRVFALLGTRVVERRTKTEGSIMEGPATSDLAIVDLESGAVTRHELVSPGRHLWIDPGGQRVWIGRDGALDVVGTATGRPECSWRLPADWPDIKAVAPHTELVILAQRGNGRIGLWSMR